MRCPVAIGWQDRIYTKVQVAAASGVFYGGILAVARRGPPLGWAFATSVSFAIFGVTFAGLQEAIRILRCHASPANSVLAGGLTGYVLTTLHSSSARRAPATLVFAAICGGGDVALNWAQLPDLWQRTLVYLDLLDAPEQSPKTLEEKQSPLVQSAPQESTEEELERRLNPEEEAPQYYHTGTWRDWLPMRKLSEEEWEKFQHKRAADFQRRVDRVTKFPPPGDS